MTRIVKTIKFMNLKQTIALVLMCASIAVKGQDINFDRFEAGFNVGLNNDGFEFEFRGLWFPVQYVGVKAGLGMASEIWELEDWYDDDPYDYDFRNEYAMRFKFTPAIVLRSPCLFQWKSQDAGFHLFAEPGVTLSPGASGSRRAKWLTWDAKGGINLQHGRFIITLGYGISGFSLYSGSPRNNNGLPDRTDYLTHTVFLGAAIKL